MSKRSKNKHLSSILQVMVAVATACSSISIFPVTTDAAYSLPVEVEAEACALSNGAIDTTNVYGTEYPGYSGDGFVWVTNGGMITLEVAITESGMYELSTRCWMYLGDEGETRLQVVSINGVSQGNFYIPNNNGWIDYSFGFSFLEAGTAKIEIGTAGSWGYILYVG